MQKRLIFLIALIFGSSVMATCQVNIENSLLWKIEGPRLTEPSYLFGTIHAICPDDFKVGADLNSIIESVEQLALEIKMDDPSLMGKMQAGMLFPEEGTIRDFVDAANYQIIERFLQDSIGININLVSRIQPIYLNSLILPKMLGCTPASVEGKLMEVAAKNELGIIGLESVEDQLAILNSIDMETQTSFLIESVKEFDEGRKEIRNMIDLYMREQVNELYDLISASEFQVYENAILTTRNQNWIPRIVEEASAKPTLFAFGSGHLGGPEGIVTLLRKAGYTLTPMESMNPILP
ncbi:TraB/GumN family protein [Fulvivirgaceae bacterium LMO-SS25]